MFQVEPSLPDSVTYCRGATLGRMARLEILEPCNCNSPPDLGVQMEATTPHY